jgi:phosphohistidine swiveling domain-containing protein
MIQDFLHLDSSQAFVGSKAYVLAMMAQARLPVPAGLILTETPQREAEWDQIFSWWKEHGERPLAVRSSAFGEDSEEMSFAGQNQTFLNVDTTERLKEAIEACFRSIDREASKSYRQFFLGERKDVPMNVVLQLMVDARFAGVYFSLNPNHAEEGAILEYVEGLGEALVSGKVTPYKVFKKSLDSTGPISCELLQKVFDLGEIVEEKLQHKIDMEWAIDQQGEVHLLQARPITSSRSEARQHELLAQEKERITQMFPTDTWWDGQTFAEWTGRPSQLTFDVWKRAFSPKGAFDDALRELGYLGFSEKSFSPHESILDNLFGRAFMNMSKMVPLYFGPIPYRMEPEPHPHLKFQWYKISAQGIFHTPRSLGRMMTVGWNMSTNRRLWIEKSRKELVDFKHKLQRPQNGAFYAGWKEEEVLNLWQKEVANFSRKSLKWPLVLVVLIEATHQSLRAVLGSVVGEEKTQDYLHRWMGTGLKTATYDMNRYFARAMEEPLKREFFFSRFGHRGPGELDLSHPRWEELGDSAFGLGKSRANTVHAEGDIEAEIHAMKTFKDTVILEEWQLLKELLELREQWKMEILRPYAHIRYLSLELGRRSGVGNDVFGLTIEEIKNLSQKKSDLVSVKKELRLRKEKLDAFKGIYLPDILKIQEFCSLLEDRKLDKNSLRGVPLSHGIVKGTVCIVNDPTEVDFSTWPADAILVASTTDPGWTPLFTRSLGVIVEHGGVLGHCAILARELGLPSINLARATQILKTGDRIWVDGHSGGVKNERNS